ncbi:MAG: Mur ligase family protein [Gaiellales bacterium]|nr:MAG: Mur ligase family protein [Gaiellales bacterium]
MAGIQDTKAAMGLKVALARSVRVASSLGGHGGTNLPGKVVRALDPSIIRRLAVKLPRGSVVVSATNGKTTTSAMIYSILAGEGLKVAHNREGANLTEGVASALLKDASLSGAPGSDLGLFEVDENHFPEVVAQGAPAVVLLMNLFRDQLDRYGELESIAQRWSDTVKRLDPAVKLVLNADDPLVADLGALKTAAVVYYGIQDESAGGDVMQHASDSKYCSVCGKPYEYRVFYIGHEGIYRCLNCGHSRPSPAIYAREVRPHGMEGCRFTLVAPDGEFEVTLGLPGLYNVYNALAAAACCLSLGISPEAVKTGLEAFSAAFGRVERLTVDGHKTILLLVKNPAGFNEVVRTLLAEPGKKRLLMALNDNIADGRDISWIWDVDLEALAGEVEWAVCSGTRAAEMAIRFKYAGVGTELLTVAGDLRGALRESLARLKEGELLYILPTYTAMLALRQAMSQHFRVAEPMGDLVWK